MPLLHCLGCDHEWEGPVDTICRWCGKAARVLAEKTPLERMMEADIMTEFGGMGGVLETRPVNTDDRFELAVERALGARMKESRDLCCDVWSALANVEWKHTNGDTAAYSFRAAGDLVAAIIGEGCYMDWYCASIDGLITEEIATAMAAEGWTGKPS